MNLDIKLGVNFRAHESIIKDLVFLSNNKLASCGYDKLIKVWDIKLKML